MNWAAPLGRYSSSFDSLHLTVKVSFFGDPKIIKSAFPSSKIHRVQSHFQFSIILNGNFLSICRPSPYFSPKNDKHKSLNSYHCVPGVWESNPNPDLAIAQNLDDLPDAAGRKTTMTHAFTDLYCWNNHLVAVRTGA